MGKLIYLGARSSVLSFLILNISILCFAGAVGGPKNMKLEKITRGQGNSWSIKFEGGNPAEVTVTSELDDFSIEVRDAKGAVIVSEQDAGDYDGFEDVKEGYEAKVKWSPSETAEFVIVIRNYMNDPSADKDSRAGKFRLRTN